MNDVNGKEMLAGKDPYTEEELLASNHRWKSCPDIVSITTVAGMQASAALSPNPMPMLLVMTLCRCGQYSYKPL